MTLSLTRRAVVGLLLSTAFVPTISLAQDKGDLESFTFNYNRSPQHLDPDTSASSVQNTVLYPIFDRLLLADDAGLVHPMLAETWEYSADGLAFTLHLKSGVTFQDGSPLDGAAVKANIDRTMTVEGATQAVLLKSIDAVEVIDDHTVTLKLNRPDSTLPYVFADLSGMMKSLASFADATTKPIGAGPFQLVEYVSGQYISYKKWDGYWDAANIHVNNLRINITSDPTTAYNSLLSGAADAAYVSGNDAKAAEDAGFVVDAHATTALYRFYINPVKATPFADKRVREALSLAIDRQAIADSLYSGYGEPASQYFPEASPYYNPDLPKLQYDPVRAKQLLVEAGYPDGFSFLSSSTTTDTGAYVAIQAMLAEVGITVEFQIQPSTEAGSTYYAGETAALLATWGGRMDPLATLALTTGDTLQNPGKLNTPEFLSLLGEAQSTTDPDQRLQVLHALDKELYDQTLNIPIILPSSIIAHRKGVAGLPSPNWTDRALDFRGVYATAE